MLGLERLVNHSASGGTSLSRDDLTEYGAVDGAAKTALPITTNTWKHAHANRSPADVGKLLHRRHHPIWPSHG